MPITDNPKRTAVFTSSRVGPALLAHIEITKGLSDPVLIVKGINQVKIYPGNDVGVLYLI